MRAGTLTLLLLECVVLAVDDDVAVQLVVTQLKGVHDLYVSAGLLAYEGSQDCG